MMSDDSDDSGDSGDSSDDSGDSDDNDDNDYSDESDAWALEKVLIYIKTLEINLTITIYKSPNININNHCESPLLLQWLFPRFSNWFQRN